MTEILVLGHVVFQHIEVDYRNPYGLAYLRSGQPDAVRGGQRLKHISQQLLQVGIVGGNVLGYLAQYGLTININR